MGLSIGPLVLTCCVSLPADVEADADADEQTHGAGEGCADEGPILKGIDGDGYYLGRVGQAHM